jgi:hypothetical protein
MTHKIVLRVRRITFEIDVYISFVIGTFWLD